MEKAVIFSRGIGYATFIKRMGGTAMSEKRTDLALEVRESFPQNHVEIQGVILKKHYNREAKAHITTVKIEDDAGSRAMKKPKGIYVTIESKLMLQEAADREPLLLCVCEELEKMVKDLRNKSVLVAGLGNREVTSDSLGPKMVDHLFITRHLGREFGDDFLAENRFGCVSAIAPGVMAQTGMEAGEILESVVEKTKPDLVIAVDALAARSVKRLCTTVQITDTGIAPGAGVGNRRRELTEGTLGVPVIAIGVPTVVDAETIIGDYMENVLTKQGYTEQEIERFLHEIFTKEMENVMVTPKNIDDSINRLSKDLAAVMNHCFQKKG